MSVLFKILKNCLYPFYVFPKNSKLTLEFCLINFCYAGKLLICLICKLFKNEIFTFVNNVENDSPMMIIKKKKCLVDNQLCCLENNLTQFLFNFIQ